MSEYILPKIKVEEIMSRKVVTVNKKDTIKKLLDTIKKYDYHGYPVMHENKVIGIVTKTDIVKIFGTKGNLIQFFASYVEDIMRHYPYTVTPNMYIEDVFNSLMKERFRSIPVVGDGEKLVGIISKTDVINNIIRS